MALYRSLAREGWPASVLVISSSRCCTSLFKQFSSGRGSSTVTEVPADSNTVLDSLTSAAGQLTPHPDLGIFSSGATALDALHATTGLPWWVVIPAAAVAIKTMLLPVSLKQARIVRTNMVLWKESYEFMRQQEMRAQHRAAAAHAADQSANCSQDFSVHQQQRQAAAPTAQEQQLQQQAQLPQSTVLDSLQQLQQWQARLQVYQDLRRKCGVPHPAWFIVNQCLQFPVFIYSSACIRHMSQSSWPGFPTEGCLWFNDLTQPALLISQAGLQLPMGLPGLILPLAVTGVMLTSIRLGFKATGAAAKHPSVSGTWLGPLLTYLPPVLYTLTLASTYIKLQLPQAAVLHWMTTSSYTLGLQLGLRHPAVKMLLGYSQPGLAAGAGGVDPAVAAQAGAIDNADILVVMGAKHAALQRYNEALYCLHRALQLEPSNVRAHYSAGQVHALQQQWQQSEECYRSCAGLSQDPQSKAQALYCLGVACHQQGKYQQALSAYDQAVGGDISIQPMLLLARVRSLRELGRDIEADRIAEEFLQSEHAKSCPPVVLDALTKGNRGAAS